MSEWRHRDEWTRRGKHFSVQVSRHSSLEYAVINGKYQQTGEVEHKWCLYAHFYPLHSYFRKFKGDDMWQEATGFFDWHKGCTFLEFHRDSEGTPYAIQVGCDYNHSFDERFLAMATKDDAREVFRDAESLFETMTNLAAA